MTTYVADNRASKLLKDWGGSPLRTNVGKGRIANFLDALEHGAWRATKVMHPLAQGPIPSTLEMLINSEPPEVANKRCNPAFLVPTC